MTAVSPPQEKDATVELWQGALAEVDRLEAELRHRSQHPQAAVMEEQAAALRGQYLLTVEQLNAELAAVKDRCRAAQAEAADARASKDSAERRLAELQSAERRQQEELSGRRRRPWAATAGSASWRRPASG